MRSRALIFIGLTFGLLSTTGCMSAYRKSVGADSNQKVYTRGYFTDLNTAWQACLEALKVNPLEISNRESGNIQTKWVDNTEQRNFVDAFGDADAALKAQFRFKVNVSNDFAYNGKPIIRVTVQKDQLLQHDVLEGWRPIETDSIDENTLLYRIGRIIYLKMKIAQLEDERIKREAATVDLSL